MSRVARGEFRFAIAASLVFGQTLASAEGSTKSTVPLWLGAELGFAFPGGSLERESPVSDVVRGIIPFGVEAGVQLQPSFLVVGFFQYAPGIPKLCATSSDCLASLGHDNAIAMGVRFVLPHAALIRPELRVALGYEWFESELRDHDATSARSYRGPLVSLQASGNLGSDSRAIGLFVAPSAGLFSHRTLQTPAFSTSASVDRSRVHFWLSLGIRGALSL
jgi:hypothetical protein